MKPTNPNSGKSFETEINHSNLTYARKKWGFIEKVEPPINISNKRGNFITGWIKEKGFVDYFGISNGRAIAFEAKSTRVRTRFPLSNVAKHQVDALKFWNEQGGIAFLLIEFQKHKEVYFVHANQFLEWWEGQATGGRKSIPYEWFVINCPLVKAKRGVLLDYLAVMDLP